MPDPRHKLTAETRAELIKLYVSGERTNVLCEKYGLTHSGVGSVIRRHDPSLLRPPRTGCRLSVRDDAFAIVDAETAYWIGFLMADGCVQKRVVTLVCSEGDIEHMYKFRAFLCSEHKIQVRNNRLKGKIFRQCRLAFASEAIVNNLRSFGVTEKKSATASVTGLEYDRNFWRGVVDGDGSLGFWRDNRGEYKPRLSLVGSMPLLYQFETFVRTYIPTRKARPFCKGTYGFTSLSTQQAITIAEVLYSNASVALERKRDIAVQMLTWRAARHKGHNRHRVPLISA